MHRAHKTARADGYCSILNLKKPIRRQQSRKVYKELGKTPLTKPYRGSCSLQTAPRSRGTAGVALAVVAQSPSEGHGVRPGDTPQGRWLLDVLVKVPLLPQLLLGPLAPGPGSSLSPTRAAGKGTPGRGDSSEVTASVHRSASQAGFNSSAPFSSFSHHWQQRWSSFSPSAPFSLQWHRGTGPTEGDGSHHHLCCWTQKGRKSGGHRNPQPWGNAREGARPTSTPPNPPPPATDPTDSASCC